MTCTPCQFIKQYLLNIGLGLDHTANAIGFGSTNETMSRRIARARDAGKKWATVVCSILSFIFRTHDHCAFAEAPGTSARELVNLGGKYTNPDLDG